MSAKTLKSLKIKSSLRCKKIYPTEDRKGKVEDLKTVALHLTSEQAVELATALLAGAQHWDIVHVTGFRGSFSAQAGGYHLTVTKQKD